MIQFCCIGPQRTASSWLQEVLSHHPSICLPRGVKETMFFDQRYHKGLPWYEWHFAHRQEGQICGEIAPTYFDCHAAAQRIHAHFPDAKIIVNVRNPIEQSYSLFRHHFSKGRVSHDFDRATRTIPNILTAAHYEQHIPIWDVVFHGQMIFLFQEDVRSNPQHVIDEVCKYLGIDELLIPEAARSPVNQVNNAPRSRTAAKVLSSSATLLRSLRLHRWIALGKKLGLTSVYRGGRVIPPMDRPTFDFLLANFDKDIAWLEKKFNRDLSKWRQQSP